MKGCGFMAQYSNSIKKKLAELICVDGNSTIKTARDYNVPLKTLEKWITAYNKNPHCFDEKIVYNDFHIISDSTVDDEIINYDHLSPNELKTLLMKKDIQIARLKKNYQVTKDGLGRKVFITFFKKNTK